MSASNLRDDLVRATLDEEWYLVYQPEIDLHHGSFVGVEALLRWRHPERGIVNPAEFIPLLGESGTIIPIGRWVLRTACYQGADWHAKGYRFSVAVNVTAEEIEEPDFVDVVRNALRSSRFTPRHLTLEFTGECVNTSGSTRLVDLAALGVTVAIDDVSPSRPPVATMTAAGVSEAKLDRQFVASSMETSQGRERIHDLISDIRNAGIRIVASGIEDDNQRAILVSEHVDTGQGFFFARPFEVNEVDRFLEDYALFSGRPL